MADSLELPEDLAAAINIHILLSKGRNSRYADRSALGGTIPVYNEELKAQTKEQLLEIINIRLDYIKESMERLLDEWEAGKAPSSVG